MIIVFDLDDTLYSELDYVDGGLMAVAKHFGGDIKKNYKELKKLREEARKHIIDRFLQAHDCWSKKRLQELINVYRRHKPHLTLYPAAKRCLQALKKRPLYLVTDGHRFVQRNKVDALGIRSSFKKTFFTSDYGQHRAKPSPYCFTKIASLEKVAPKEILYVADNPTKDFVGIKPLGFQTLRVHTGQHKDIKVQKAYDADFHIHTLDEFLPWLKTFESKHLK
ncbi:MAG TPA: HAD family hydrolase [Chlamydiales bacterium]|nr:HAD family hydrolase [Chlamydiales bacterium]